MAPLPKKSIDHFIHPGHPLTPFDGDNEYLCDGCKTLGGAGKRFRCSRGCDFDLHDYCATCPRHLTSFMHKPHALELVMRKGQPQQRVHDRVCNVCKDPVEGLFYRCKKCDFDAHPLCTQLPEKLHHALHKTHPLTLRSSPTVVSCAVCRGSCESAAWRYRCGDCDFHIHLECVLKPVVSCGQKKGPPPPQTSSNQRSVPPVFDQGIPFQPPPQFAPYCYYYGFPYQNPGYLNHPGFNYGYPFNMHYNNNLTNMPQNNHQVGASSGGNGTGRNGKSMFALVGQLGFGVISNMVFGVDLTSFI